jgi:FixJ family two-component response regulator
MDLIKMPRERCVHIVDDEVRVREALTVLLSTAEIESRSYGSAEEDLPLIAWTPRIKQLAALPVRE